MNYNALSSLMMSLISILTFFVLLAYLRRIKDWNVLAYLLALVIISPGYLSLAYQYHYALPLTAAPFIRVGVAVLVLSILSHYGVRLLLFKKNRYAA